MYTILVYLLNETYRQELLDYFRLPQFDLFLVSREQEVADICSKELVDMILIWDATLQSVKKIQLALTQLQIEDIPLIPVVTRSSDFHASIEAGVVNVIQIPIPRTEFSQIIQQLLKIEELEDQIAKKEEELQKYSLTISKSCY